MVDTQKAELQFVADTSGVDDGFNKVDRGLKNLEQETQKASRTLETFWGSFAGGLASGAIQGLASGIADAFKSLPDLIERGAAVDDITSAFQNLSKEAGIVGDTFRDKLSAALGDTIPKVELMQKASDLMLGGLKPDQIELVAKAARTLGEVTGTNASQGMDQLSDSLLRGNDRALKTLGIVVDNKQAIEDYAASIHKATKDLSEQEQVEAIRAASLQALAENTERLGAVTDDAGDIIAQMSASLTDQKDAALQALANNQELQGALVDLRDTIATIDFGPIIAGLGLVITKSAEAASAILAFTNGTSAIDRAIGRTSGEFKVLDAELVKVTEILSGGTVDSIKKAEKAYNDLVTVINETGVSQQTAAALGDDMKFVKDQIEAAKRSFGLLPPEIAKTDKALTGVNTGLKNHAGATRASADETKKHAAEEKKRNEELEKAQRELTKIFVESERYQNILARLSSGTITSAEADSQLKQAYLDLQKATNDAAVAQEVLRLALDRVGKGANIAQIDLAELTKEAEKSAGTLAGLSAKPSKNNEGEAKGGGFLSGLLGNISNQGTFDGAELAGQQIGQAVLDGLSKALSGEKLSKAEIGQSIGGGLGGAIGAYFGGAAGAQIGSTLGSAIGGGLANAFGSRDTQGKVRDSLDRMFADILKDNPLQAIIEGQLSTIKDLDFFRGTDAFNTGAFDDALQKLSASAQAAFGGIAEGFSEVFGQGSDLAGQLAAVLADNLGGSLNNLQLLVEASGKSFEDLKNATVEAFLDGKLSALEAQTALNGIAQVAQKGIPDGIGQVSTAFDNLKAAGTKGGRALVDALQDIGFEAKELGQKDLSQVITTLQATGKYSAAEIQQVFDALKASGITSVDQLTKATVDQLLPVLSQLEATKFPFAEQVKDVRAYIDAVDSIPTSKTVELNFKVNYPSEADRQVVQSISRPGGPGGAQL